MRITPLLNDFRESYVGLRVRESIWCYRFQRNYAPLVNAIVRFDDCKERKSRAQLKREMLLCKRFWKCYPWHYFLYDLYREDQLLTDEQLLNYVPEFFFYEIFLPHHNTRQLNVLCGDKGIIDEMFSGLGIPHPTTLCKVIDGRLYTGELRPMSCEQLLEQVQSSPPARMVWKPANGRGGHGVLVFHRGDNDLYATRNGITLNRGFLESATETGKYVLQVGVEQHPSMSKIYPHSLNTLRITTENLRGVVRLINAELRMGRSGREVDNASQSGVEVFVDTATGELGKFGLTGDGGRFDRHPDTGFLFEGFSVPNWKQIEAAVLDFAGRIPRLAYLGWDIGLSVSGIVVVEVNWGFGIDGQNLFGGLRDALRIENPDYYWKNRGNR